MEYQSAGRRKLSPKAFGLQNEHKKGGYPITGQPLHLLSLIV